MSVINVISNSSKSGTYNSSSHLIPSNITGNIAVITMDIDSNDLTDTAKSLEAIVYYSDDDSTWKKYLAFTWKGQSTAGHGQSIVSPTISVNLSELKGKYVKVTVTSNTSVKYGFNIENK